MRYRQAIVGSCASIGLPTAARFSQESGGLDEKLASQIEWMRRRGIDIQLKETERPSVEEKPPLPGTVIDFSIES